MFLECLCLLSFSLQIPCGAGVGMTLEKGQGCADQGEAGGSEAAEGVL